MKEHEVKASKKLTKAINKYTGIAPAFAQQVAEMLVTYYGAPGATAPNYVTGDRLEIDGLLFEVTDFDPDEDMIELRLLL
jgi:hypothetical protein